MNFRSAIGFVVTIIILAALFGGFHFEVGSFHMAYQGLLL